MTAKVLADSNVRLLPQLHCTSLDRYPSESCPCTQQVQAVLPRLSRGSHGNMSDDTGHDAPPVPTEPQARHVVYCGGAGKSGLETTFSMD